MHPVNIATLFGIKSTLEGKIKDNFTFVKHMSKEFLHKKYLYTPFIPKYKS